MKQKGTQYTPGPWHPVIHHMDDKMYPIVADADPSSAICYVGTKGYPNKANARLVAAAPELLEAATEVIRAIQCIRRDPNGMGGTVALSADWPDTLDALRDAIAKVKGA